MRWRVCPTVCSRASRIRALSCSRTRRRWVTSSSCGAPCGDWVRWGGGAALWNTGPFPDTDVSCRRSSFRARGFRETLKGSTYGGRLRRSPRKERELPEPREASLRTEVLDAEGTTRDAVRRGGRRARGVRDVSGRRNRGDDPRMRAGCSSSGAGTSISTSPLVSTFAISSSEPESSTTMSPSKGLARPSSRGTEARVPSAVTRCEGIPPRGEAPLSSRTSGRGERS